MNLVSISGSRNPRGQTARAAEAVCAAVEAHGGKVQRYWLPELKIERCRQCGMDGWGICRTEGRCIIEDDLAGVFDAMVAADVVIISTPVYFADLAESLRAFLDRVRRTCTFGPGEGRLKGKRTFGICVAGGGGGGAPNCCLNLQGILARIGMDVVDMFPLRRQNLAAKLRQLEQAGRWLAEGPQS